jgi:hypothetical protein
MRLHETIAYILQGQVKAGLSLIEANPARILT